MAHKKEFAKTGNFKGSPKASGDGIKTVAALHQSEYGGFNKDGKLKPIGDLSDDQATLDELASRDKSNRPNLLLDATNNEESMIASAQPKKHPRRLKSLPKHAKV